MTNCGTEAGVKIFDFAQRRKIILLYLPDFVGYGMRIIGKS
jgi:hypothetical protein